MRGGRVESVKFDLPFWNNDRAATLVIRNRRKLTVSASNNKGLISGSHLSQCRPKSQKLDVIGLFSRCLVSIDSLLILPDLGPKTYLLVLLAEKEEKIDIDCLSVTINNRDLMYVEIKNKKRYYNLVLLGN
ncbi:hypothetical protein TNCT_551261 [Trichonephila clavata]|uniref:Uncharacterized protein n=1 Tax=Trichonephila clavata TaxID=2740835 RepID=A0A8X6LN20_TRICU|nr:hypothetical protein TNCT_551261 [Trichonephila clavata]